MEKRAIFWLKSAFIIGAVIDGLALLPMCIPWAAELFLGFDGFTGIYYFAMGMGASLMLAWTILLIWACRKPLERRFIALFTVIILVGIAATELVLAGLDYIPWRSVTGSLVMQAALLVLFNYGFIVTGRVTAN